MPLALLKVAMSATSRRIN